MGGASSCLFGICKRRDTNPASCECQLRPAMPARAEPARIPGSPLAPGHVPFLMATHAAWRRTRMKSALCVQEAAFTDVMVLPESEQVLT